MKDSAELMPASDARLELLEHLLAEEGFELPESETISRRKDLSEHPLSFGQQRLWFLDQLEQGTHYNEAFYFRFTVPLDVAALERSLTEILRRHEVLRATFALENGVPVQRIAPLSPVKLPMVDLTGGRARHSVRAGVPQPESGAHGVTRPTDLMTTAQRLAEADLRQRFDLTRGPLWRFQLLRLAGADHLLVVTIHHIVIDGWSRAVFLEELSALYSAFASDGVSPLPEPAIQYADFAAWQRETLRGEALEKDLAWWQQELSGPLQVLELPTDRPRPPVQTFDGACQPFTVPPPLVAALKELAHSEGATLFMVVMAAFQTLLHRYSGQDEIIFGTPVAGRPRKELERLIGFFLNLISLRTRFAGNPAFRELLRRVRDTSLGAFAHQDLPLDRLLEKLQLERNLRHAVLFQVLFIFQNTPRAAGAAPGITLNEFHPDKGTAMYDLNLSINEDADGLHGWLVYKTGLFDDGTIRRTLGHFRALLEGIVADPGQRVSRLPLLAPAERRQLLIEWNDTQTPMPSYACMHQGFEAQVERTPDAVAVVFDGRLLTYRELNVRANQLAHHLRGLGVGPETLVALCLERSLEMVVALLAVHKAGGAYVPVDPDYPKDRIEFVLQDSQAPVLLTHEAIRGRFDFSQPKFQVLALDKEWGIIAKESGENPACERTAATGSQNVVGASAGFPFSQRESVWVRENGDDPSTSLNSRVTSAPSPSPPPSPAGKGGAGRDLTTNRGVTGENAAYVIYTSGSTGRPKGVVVTHRAVVNFLESMRQQPGFTAQDTLLAITTLSFDIAGLELFLPLMTGGKVVIARRETILDGVKLARQLRECGATVMQGTPAIWRALLDSGWAGSPGLKILCGGEAWTAELAEQLLPRCAALWNMYGPTETTIWSAASKIEAGQPVFIGGPVANTQLYVLDAELQPVPIGVPGELHIGGEGLARGYLNRPELTAEKFVPNPFVGRADLPVGPDARQRVPTSRLYKTGDLVRYRADGRIEFLGRMDHQVKVRGFRIELGEIESVLRQHPNLREAVVVAKDGAAGDKRLAAYVLPQKSPAPTLNDLRRWCAEKLPDYMVPSAFVNLDALPLTPNGKVDRRALPAPEAARLDLEEAFVAPRTSVEIKLAKIWCSLLGVKEVGVNDNFYSLGGHSLLATQVISQIRVTFETEVSLRDFFESPTVADLAAVIEKQKGQGVAGLPPAMPALVALPRKTLRPPAAPR